MNAALIYKQIAAFFLLAAFFVQVFHKSLLVADYYTHTAVYEKDCVNKDKPKMNCHGHCQLSKKLQKEEQQDQQNPDRRAENKNEVLFCDENNELDFSPFILVVSLTQLSLLSNEGLYPGYTPGIFHPPGLLSV